MTIDRRIEAVLRENAPLVLGALVRRHGQFAACEDATQEAMIAAAAQWPDAGIPEHPRAWLIAVAGRRLVDEWRSESARRQREEGAALAVEEGAVSSVDDSLTLLFLCCHPVLSAPSQLALTLRAVGGLTTAEIARAFLVPESTMAQRISRAKAAIRASGARFELPEGPEFAARLAVVMHVLYLIFNEGYTASAGDTADRVDLAQEAIRLARMLRERAPGEAEAAGLLALMLLTDARRPARIDPDGMLVPLAEQNRGLWDRERIAEGVDLLSGVLGTAPVGPYQLQAAIAAVHDEAETAETTDWPQILALYEVLAAVSPGPVVTLNRAVAVAMVEGPRAGLALLDGLDAGSAAALGHRLPSVRADLLERAGERDAAREEYLSAARGGATRPELHYLAAQAARLR